MDLVAPRPRVCLLPPGPDGRRGPHSRPLTRVPAHACARTPSAPRTPLARVNGPRSAAGRARATPVSRMPPRAAPRAYLPMSVCRHRVPFLYSVVHYLPRIGRSMGNPGCRAHARRLWPPPRRYTPPPTPERMLARFMFAVIGLEGTGECTACPERTHMCNRRPTAGCQLLRSAVPVVRGSPP